MVITAKEEPDGLGSIAEEIALAGKFFVPDEQKVKDSRQEQLLLHATVEELVCHDIALPENAVDGRYLVFPSQFNRDYEDAKCYVSPKVACRAPRRNRLSNLSS